MRWLIVVSLILLAACSASPKADDARKPATVPTYPPNIPASSADALEAKAVVERYFKALVAKDYHSAYLLWADKGAAVRGTERAFAETFADYAKYDPKTGDPSEIHVRDGVQYVLVSASVDVVHRHNGESWHREGTVALKRSADRAVKDPDMRDWRIWSVDIRVKH